MSDDDIDPALDAQILAFRPDVYADALQKMQSDPLALTDAHLEQLRTISQRHAAEALALREAARVARAAAVRGAVGDRSAAPPAVASAPPAPSPDAHRPLDAQGLAAIVVKTIKRALAPRDARLAALEAAVETRDARLITLEADLATLRQALEDRQAVRP